MSAVRLGLPHVNPPDEDFDCDPSDRRVIGWVGVAILVIGVLVLLMRMLQ